MQTMVTAPRWRMFWPVLALAFALRAAVALGGDSLLHPDEVQQYLEPAHALVFGNGLVWPEWHYGARQWWIPGLVAGVLAGADALGAGRPEVYVPAVELLFCALSLAVPAGMYGYARHAFGEASGRAALIAGTGWYELAGLAPKPFTEFVATGALMLLLAAAARPRLDSRREGWTVALLAVATGALRVLYAPLALLVLVYAWRRATAEARKALVLGTLALAAAVGVADGALWDGAPFHSYLAYVGWNAAMPRFGETPLWLAALWFPLATAGLGPLVLALGVLRWRRYALPLGLAGLLVALHLVPGHKEYRFIFALAPLWLVVGADLAVRAGRRTGTPGGTMMPWTVGAAAGGASTAGLLFALPLQWIVYTTTHTPPVMAMRFLGPDPLVETYRWLRRDPEVEGVWHRDRHDYSLPGYYHLHRAIPWYDATRGGWLGLEESSTRLHAYATHVVTSDPRYAVRGYEERTQIGPYRVLARVGEGPPVRRWASYRPNNADSWHLARLLRAVVPHASPVPPCGGIAFEAEEAPGTWCGMDGSGRKSRYFSLLLPDHGPAHGVKQPRSAATDGTGTGATRRRW